MPGNAVISGAVMMLLCSAVFAGGNATLKIGEKSRSLSAVLKRTDPENITVHGDPA